MSAKQDTVKNRIRIIDDKIGKWRALLIGWETTISCMEADLKMIDGKPSTHPETINAVITRILELKKRCDDAEHTMNFLIGAQNKEKEGLV